MSAQTITAFLNSDDPLSDEAVDRLLQHREEDAHVDYKEDFDPKSGKEWLGLNKDVMAFANTSGGYLVFGVRDATFERVGVSKGASEALADINRLMQKLNRFVRPHFTRIRAKSVQRDKKTFVVVHVPETKGRTHIVVKDAFIKYPSGERKAVLTQGMIFVRRSGCNHRVADPDSLDSIFGRRLEHFRSSVLDKIARVVDAPAEHEVIVVKPDSAAIDGRSFVVSDAPDALPIKGASFSLAPRTDEQEVSVWIALAQKDADFIPPSDELWRLYSRRDDLGLSPTQSRAMARFCLVRQVPTFYWIQELAADDIKGVLAEAIAADTGISEKAYIVKAGGFLGRGFHRGLLARLGSVAERLGKRTREFPKNGPREFFSPNLVDSIVRTSPAKSAEKLRAKLEAELTRLAETLAQRKGDALARKRAQDLDCYLYARDDRYKNRGSGGPEP